jgi:hypothetical protein
VSVLRKINPSVQRAVADASLPLRLIESRTKPWFGGDTKEYDTLLTIPIEKTFREAGGRVTEELVVDDEVMAYAIMRGALQVGTCFLFAFPLTRHQLSHIHTVNTMQFLRLDNSNVRKF